MPYKLVAISCFPLNPFSNGLRWVQNPVADAYPGQFSVPFEVFYDIVMVFGATDLRYTQKQYKLVLC
jgi:hypothetical protein